MLSVYAWPSRSAKCSGAVFSLLFFLPLRHRIVEYAFGSIEGKCAGSRQRTIA